MIVVRRGVRIFGRCRIQYLYDRFSKFEPIAARYRFDRETSPRQNTCEVSKVRIAHRCAAKDRRVYVEVSCNVAQASYVIGISMGRQDMINVRIAAIPKKL